MSASVHFPAATKLGGLCLGSPDVCRVPAVPKPVETPFPNIGQLNTAIPDVLTVLISKKEPIVESTKLPMSSGDEAGSLGGVVSGTVAGEVSFKQASSKVYFAGKKAVLATALTAHNGTNANAPVGVLQQVAEQVVLLGM